MNSVGFCLNRVAEQSLELRFRRLADPRWHRRRQAASLDVMLPHAGDRGAVGHSCFSILRIVLRLGSQCSSERDQNWSLGTN